MVAQADFLFGMTRSHLLALASHNPLPTPRLQLLSPEGEDLPDPIGCDREVYKACAQQITQWLEKRLPELQP
jgi:protein-tyrosine-phosphatase